MTDYKTLCAQLIELWDADCDIDQEINQLRLLLAQPEPEGPTDEELYDLFDWLKDEWHSNDEREFPLPLFARAVLVRWGSHPPRSNS